MLPKFPQLEETILSDWKKKNIFKKTLKQTADGQRFVFFEGPPTANGKPGIHHVLARVFKDIIPRFRTMQGYFVERKAGWDTQGLPVELEVEKQIGVSGKKDIEAYGVEKFNNACKKSVWEYQEEWEKMTDRIGFWLDLDNPYITYHNSYIETLWWIFKQIWDKKLLFQGHKVVPQCPSCGTALSSHEVAQGYESVSEPSIFVKFKVKNESDTYILSWTTTPWTLPGNVALAVGEKYDYVKIQKDKETLILAENCLGVIEGEYKVIEKLKGKKLVGLEYEPLFNGLADTVKDNKEAFKTVAADFVTVNEGTGVVHTAVMYGEDDYQLGEKIGLPKKHTVNEDGKFNELVPQWQGKFVKSADKDIIKDLEFRGLLYKTQDYTHDYPFCWRCHGPLLYYAKDSWFIKMSSLRKQLIKNNEQINWVPDYIKKGRFGEWLNEVKDWAISRERYWGTPIPIWECQDSKCGTRTCIGSFEELEKHATKPLAKEFDPHRPYIDDVLLTCPKCQGEMKRIPEVADTWFDSGSMPFAQWHYPFENKERIDKNISFPADYIAEAIDQTRGWFYTLLAISTALGFDKPPYKNVVCLGHILDSKGKKMSKHIGNVIKPEKIIDEFGIDAVRWYLYSMNQPGEYKSFDERGVRDVVKKNFMILWNVLNLFKLYQTPSAMEESLPRTKNIMDGWLLSRLQSTILSVTQDLETYHITEATRTIGKFIDELSTWYIRRSRDRFKSSDESEKLEALRTLRYALLELSKLMAPFTPFIADALYQEVKGPQESVHLAEWPKPVKEFEDEDLLAEMERVRQVTELTHAARAESGIKVRQPLSQLIIKAEEFRTELVDILKAEVNVHEIIFKSEPPKSSDWQVKEAGSVMISLDKTITDELYYQGFIREMIRQVNSLRKKTGLTIQDRVSLVINTTEDKFRQAIDQHSTWLKEETLADDINYKPIQPEDCDATVEVKHDDQKIVIGLNKVN
ncbi:isoleucine--tRNA ligase [Patescibacteria group bacterium]|nr:isoleucine--tRNA ligase [Patescibacteria group bacterium]MBU1890703.1 isoleucine--tRNA ligase [Patescibacteria group bacterium]